MKKEEFKQKKTRDALNELANYISHLEDTMGEIAEGTKEEYLERLETLREIKKNLTAKLEKYEQVADSKWEAVKESAANFFASVRDAWKENCGKVTDASKKD